MAASRLELDNLASFLKGAVAYKKKIGFKGELLLEPKPQVSASLHPASLWQCRCPWPGSCMASVPANYLPS